MGAQLHSPISARRPTTDEKEAIAKRPCDHPLLGGKRFLFCRQEPVNVPAILTDKACGGGIGPVKVKERCNRRVQLSFAPPKPCVMADFTTQRITGDLAFFCFFSAKQSHLCGSNLIAQGYECLTPRSRKAIDIEHDLIFQRDEA